MLASSFLQCNRFLQTFQNFDMDAMAKRRQAGFSHSAGYCNCGFKVTCSAIDRSMICRAVVPLSPRIMTSVCRTRWPFVMSVCPGGSVILIGPTDTRATYCLLNYVESAFTVAMQFHPPMSDALALICSLRECWPNRDGIGRRSGRTAQADRSGPFMIGYRGKYTAFLDFIP